VARVAADGVVEARREGRVTLRAAVEGGADSIAVVVRPPLAARIAFVSAPDTLRVRRADTVRVVLYDSAGAPMPVRPRLTAEAGPAGGAAAATVAAPNGAGDALVVTGAAVGTAQLVATGDGLTVRRPLAVVPLPQGPPGAYPAQITAVAGASILVAGRGQDVDGFAQAAAVTFATDNPAVATVTEAGVVVARGAGTASIEVRTGATQRRVPVDVVAGSGFALEIRPAGGPLPASLQTAMADASAAWSRAIVGDLPDVSVTLPARRCEQADAVTLDVDDVVVFARVDSIDGRSGVLAQAGPCVLRSDGRAAVGGDLGRLGRRRGARPVGRPHDRRAPRDGARARHRHGVDAARGSRCARPAAGGGTSGARGLAVASVVGPGSSRTVTAACRSAARSAPTRGTGRRARSATSS
jgi:hypothetical protein